MLEGRTTLSRRLGVVPRRASVRARIAGVRGTFRAAPVRVGTSRRVLMGLVAGALLSPTLAWASTDGPASSVDVPADTTERPDVEDGLAAPPGDDAAVAPDPDDSSDPEPEARSPSDDGPGVTLVVVPAVVRPGHPHGVEPFELEVAVRAPDPAVGLERLRVCLHGPAVDAGCAGAADGAADQVLLEWTPEEGVVVVGPDRHRDAGSVVTPTEGGLEATLRIAVGPSASAGPGWRVVVDAIDDDGAAVTAEAGGLEVAWFAARLEGRHAVDYGELGVGDATSIGGTTGGRFVVNGPAAVVMRATPFAHAGDRLLLAGGTPRDPAPWRTVALDCSLGAVFHEAAAARLREDWQRVGPALDPRPDHGVIDIGKACRARYGGGARHLGIEYVNDVEVDLVPVVP